MRTLYQLLLTLHPPAFRQRFSEEFQQVYDETPSHRRPFLFADILRSLFVQWFLRVGIWRHLFGIVAACTVLAKWHSVNHTAQAYFRSVKTISATGALIGIALLTLFLVFATLFTVFWSQYVHRRRRAANSR
jgi:hypothetical protein